MKKYSMDYMAYDASCSFGCRGIGFQMLDELPDGRKTCSEGREAFTLTADLVLMRGHKSVTVKASPEKPITGYTIIYPMSGRDAEFVHPLDRK